MIVAGYKREAINRLGARLRATLTRCDPPLPKSLRLMAVHVVKEGILRRLQGHTEIHPGMKKLAAWGGCSERQARRNLRALENWGLLTAVACAKGGNSATRFWVEPEAIVRVMVTLEANPHPELVAEIRDMMGAVRADIRADIDPGHEAGHMSAGYIYTRRCAPSPPFPVSTDEPTMDPFADICGGDLLRKGRARPAASASPSQPTTSEILNLRMKGSAT